MAGNDVGGAGPADGRTHIYVQDSIFMPDHNRVMRFITSLFALQTCDEGYSWKYVTVLQKEWYWDEFVKRYRWDVESDAEIRRVWYYNISTQYRRTIHSWRSTGNFPIAFPAERRALWTDAWSSQEWKDRAVKNKSNRASEPAGSGTGPCKHIAGSKTYSAHYHSMKAAQSGTDPTTWDLFQHTHRRPDGTFVDERSRLVNQSMTAYLDESLTPLDDGTIPEQPSSDEVNSMFHHVVGGRKKGRMYGCGSMASSIYPHEMAPRPRGGRSGASSSQHSVHEMREELEQQKRIVEYLRLDLQASERRSDEFRHTNDELRKTNDDLRQTQMAMDGRMGSMEEQIRFLVSGMPQVPQTHPGSQTYCRPAYSSGVPVRGRSTTHRGRDDRVAASTSRIVSRGKVLRLPTHDSSAHRFSQQWVPSSQDFGRQDDDDDDDDGDDDGDDDETQAY